MLLQLNLNAFGVIRSFVRSAADAVAVAAAVAYAFQIK